jgi:hypothetical protein
LIDDELSEAFEGKNLQPHVAWQSRVGKEIPFQLIRGLLRRQQNERQTLRRRGQRGANLLQTTERFSTAGGAKEELDLHDLVLSRGQKRLKETKQFYFGGWTVFDRAGGLD